MSHKQKGQRYNVLLYTLAKGLTHALWTQKSWHLSQP